MSLIQTNFASALPFMSRVRRIAVLSSRETDGVAIADSGRRHTAFEIVQKIMLPLDASHEQVEALLSPEALCREGISGVLIANGEYASLAPVLARQLRMKGIEVLSESSLLEQERGYIDVNHAAPYDMVLNELFAESWGKNVIKRGFDLVFAIALLMAALPLMVLIALLIKLDSSGPIMYRQERVGLRGRTFTLFKFRSMRQNAEADGSPRWATIGDPRITRIGKFIRYTRIDELPQLVNVLRGEMSLIGPRPERPYFVDQLTAALPLYSVRHMIKPGITGWAQVNASYGASIEDGCVKLMYDLYYIKYRTFLLDLKILLRTVAVVLLQEGAR